VQPRFGAPGVVWNVGTGTAKPFRAKREICVGIGAWLALVSLVVPPDTARALGTSAGEDVVNTAQVTYNVGGPTLGPILAGHTFIVDELIDVDVTLQTAAPVVTTAGATGQILTFLVTNIGNGTETFPLTQNTALVGNDFDPTPAGIYFDTNGNGTFDGPGPDTLYVPGVNDPVLDANTPGADRVTVFLVDDIPAVPAPANGDRGDAELVATAAAHSGAPGTFTLGAGDAGTVAVAGASGGDGASQGTYLISDTAVQITKSAAVDDGTGGNTPIPGALITYRLDVDVVGTDTALGIVITDPIPLNTTYQPSTITLNGAPLTDVGGDDVADFNATNPGEVTFAVGDLDSTSPTQTITFQVRIN
jgi:uncharacterized repeat protein (TIGR01451 family)